jgi:hypothetical protein
MKTKLKKRILDGSIFNLIKHNLIELYNKIKNDPNPNKKDIKILGYHAIAYFQYINLLGVHQAVDLYKEHILSDGKNNILTDKFYYLDGDRKMKVNKISVPLFFDDLLSDVSKYLMNYKDIIKTITKSGYKKYIIDKYHINASDITISHIIKLLREIKIYSLIALKKHWITINKEILPFLLEKSQVVESKD